MRLLIPIPAPQPRLAEATWPYKALWARVVIRALYDYVTFKSASRLHHKRDFQSAKWWLFGADTGFVEVCELLDWPVERLRRAAQTMTSNDVRKLEHYEREGGLLSRRGERGDHS